MSALSPNESITSGASARKAIAGGRAPLGLPIERFAQLCLCRRLSRKNQLRHNASSPRQRLQRSVAQRLLTRPGLFPPDVGDSSFVAAYATGIRSTWYRHPDNQGGTLSQRHYLSAASQTIGVLDFTAALSALASGPSAPPNPALPIPLAKVKYWYKDPLGSLITATDHTGAASARFADDPIGKAGSRCPTGARDAAGSLVINWEPILDRDTDLGFTGHEQLDDIGLVQMNRNRRICDAGLVRLRFL